MKKLILFLFFAPLSIMIYAQAGTQTFNISAGGMFPQKDLGNNNLVDSSSGFAANGYHIEVSYNYQLSNHFGMTLDVEFNSAKYSFSKLKKYFEENVANTQYDLLSTENWSLGGIFVSYYLRLPIGKTSSWDFAPLVGFLATYTPEYQMTTIVNLSPPKTYYRQRSKAFSFAYGVDSKINIKTGHHGFFLEGRLLYSSANFKQVKGTDILGRPYDMTIKMNLMYITTGLGYTYYF